MAAPQADALIIGAGHNGLVAANLLADAGWSVVVLEAADAPGGAVRTAEVTAPGFHSDLYSAFYPLGFASPVLRALKLEEHGLSWRHSPSVLSHVLSDGRAVTLHRDIDATAASLDAFVPGDGDAWRVLFDEWVRIGPAVVDALFAPFPPVRSGWGLLRSLGSSAELLRFVRFGLLPVRRFGEERFAGEGAKLLLTGNALHTDLSPEGAGSAVFGWLLAMLGQEVGFPVPAGGSGRLIDALVARLRRRGGELICGQAVSAVIVADGRAVGVRTHTGTVHTARHAVLADVPAPVLYRDLVDRAELPARLIDDLATFQWDNATIKVDWALSTPVPWVAEAARGSGTLHLGADLNGLTRYAAELATGSIPTEPFVLFGQMGVADPSRCPPGAEVAWGYTHVPWSGELSAGQVDVQVDRMEQAVERVAPGFRATIVARHVAGPHDLQDANAALVGGAINGGTAAIHQQLIFRPTTGLGRPETPIQGLYLAGSSAHPGGGVHGGPGANAARVALRRRTVLGPVRAAVIRAAMRRVYR